VTSFWARRTTSHEECLSEIARLPGVLPGRQHAVVASSALVPRNEPTLLFTNAGMVQFKNVFTAPRSGPTAAHQRAEMRARRGKHKRSRQCRLHRRHHTFFEMLGNFSFGDYFKDDAIAFAWDITQRGGPAKDKLWSDPSSALRRAGCGRRSPAFDAHHRPCGTCGRWVHRPLRLCSEYSSTRRAWPAGARSPDEDGDRFLNSGTSSHAIRAV